MNNKKRDRRLLLFVFLVAPLIGIFLFQNVVTTVTYFVPAEYYFNVREVTILDSSEINNCGRIDYTISRVSRINTNIEYVIELTLINLESISEVERASGVASIDAAERLIKFQYDLPCDLKRGNYYISSANIFEVNGIEKVTIFETPIFKITE